MERAPECPFISTRMNTLTPSFQGNSMSLACSLVSKYRKSEEKDSSKDSSRKELCSQQKYRAFTSETGICGILHLPSRHKVLRPFFFFSSSFRELFSGLYVRSAQGMVSFFPWQQPTYPLSVNLLVQLAEIPF